MDNVSAIRGNGTGFLHLSRRLHPGENVPAAPSLADQLLACRLTHASVEMEAEPVETETDDF